MLETNTLSTPKLTMKFCSHREEPPKASANLLPIMINSCPEDFSTVDYFEVNYGVPNGLEHILNRNCIYIQNLKSQQIGRLAIYVPIITTTMNVLADLEYGHGLAVITRQQTTGIGRNNNQVNNLNITFLVPALMW